MEDKITDRSLDNYVSQVEFLRFKEQIVRELNEKEKHLREDIYKVQISNAQIVPLLESISENIRDINDSHKEVTKSVGFHTVDIAVLKEMHNSKPAEQSKDNPKGLGGILEYKKTIWISLIGLAGTIGVALLNNADKILSVFGL